MLKQTSCTNCRYNNQDENNEEDNNGNDNNNETFPTSANYATTLASSTPPPPQPSDQYTSNLSSELSTARHSARLNHSSGAPLTPTTTATNEQNQNLRPLIGHNGGGGSGGGGPAGTSSSATSLLAPHFFLPGSSGSFILADFNGSSSLLPLFGGAAAGGPASQFASLTPDARACVTATYLCVLIVNNTWLDCNLLDSLCNNGTSRLSGSGRSSSGKRTRGDAGERDDSIVRDALNASKWLATNGRRRDESFFAESALESALSGLIAFAGGGHSDEEDEGGGGGGGRSNTSNGRVDDDKRRGIYLVPVQLAHATEPEGSRQVPIILHDTGGGGDSSAFQTSLYAPNRDGNGNGATGYIGNSDGGASVDQADAQWPPLLPPPPSTGQQQYPSVLAEADPSEKMARLVDEDKNRVFEQYFKFRKYQTIKISGNNNNNQQQQQQMRLAPVSESTVAESGGDMSPESSRGSTNLSGDTSGGGGHTNFVNVEPGFGQTIQPSGPGSTTPTPISSPTGLVSWVGRPFRGWGSYSFWSSSNTNSNSNNNADQLGGLSQAKQVQLDPTGGGGGFNGGADIHSAYRQNNVQILRPIDRSEQQQFNDIATNGAGQSNIKSSAGHAHLQQTQHLPMAEDDGPGYTSTTMQDYAGSTTSAMASGSGSQQQQPTVAPSSSLLGIYDYTGGNSNNNNNRNQHHLKLQQQQQQQSVLIGVSSSNPNLNEQNHMIPSGSSYAPNGGTTGLSLPLPSTPMVASSSSSPSISSTSGKMNPLDVTFLLYTRYNRDLAQEMSHLAGTVTSSQQHSGQATIVSPTTAMTANGIATATSNAANPTGAANPVQLATSASQLSLYGSSSGQQQDSLAPAGVSDIIDLTNETTLNESRLNSSLPIKIIIHGFGSGGRRPWVTDMVYKLLDYEDVNVIVVDWEKGAVLPNYVQAAGNTRIVGHKIANLIRSINAKYGLTGNRYHLIGFSLGAHVAGFAGMELRNSSNVSRHWINRITGLDPASPLFEGYEANDRLDPSDAQFVDVIHSNGDGVLRGGFGSLQPMGHVDFYPNGGRVQVGCNSVLLSALSDIIYGKWQSLCNHRRALNFFMDSFEFSKCRFRSFNCDSYESYLRGECFDCGHNNEKCSYMGYLANYSKGRGKMYLTTHEEAPFCANQFIIKIIGSKGYKTHWGKVEVTLVTIDGKNESFWLSSSISSGQSTSSSSSSSSSSSTSSSSLSSASSSSSTLAPLSPSSPSTPSTSGSSAASASSLASMAPPLTSSSPSPSLLTTSATTLVTSAAHELGPNQKELSQQSMQSLVVAHPSLMNFTQIHLRYTKYKGWIYSGDENWPIDKVFITDSDGQVKSYCGHNTILESYVTTRLNLEPGNCTVMDSQQSVSTVGSSSSSSSLPGSVVAGTVQGSRIPMGTGVVGPSQQANGQQQQQQQSPRTPRLLASIMHQQQSMGGPGGNHEHHHHHQQQQQQLHHHHLQVARSPYNHQATSGHPRTHQILSF